MKKDLVIPMEEECLICPNLSLVTRQYGIYANGKPHKVHECEHLDFCEAVRKTWEKVRNEQEAEE